jgi:hypothetical protein
MNESEDIMQLRQQITKLRAERDAIRRTFCFMVASGNLNVRDGNTQYRSSAEYVAELNRWDCFESKQ